MSKRTDAIKQEHANSGTGGVDKWNYVDTHMLERMGITQYKSEVGENIFRIIPQQDPEAFFMKEIFLHYKIGADGHNILCARRMFNESCPICELRDKIVAADPKDETEKALRYSVRFLMFLVNTKNTEESKKGLRWYDGPGGFKRNILALSKNPRSGEFIDISDPEEGGDIMFIREGKALNTKYLGFQILGDGEMPDLELYAATPNTFDEILKRPDYEFTQNLLDGCPPIKEKAKAPAKKEKVPVKVNQDPKEEEKAPAKEEKAPPFDADSPKEGTKISTKEEKKALVKETGKKLSVQERIAAIQAKKKAETTK